MNNSFLKALAVLKFVVVFCCAGSDCFVMTVDNLLDVIHTTVAQFYRVLVDDLVELIIRWEA